MQHNAQLTVLTYQCMELLDDCGAGPRQFPMLRLVCRAWFLMSSDVVRKLVSLADGNLQYAAFILNEMSSSGRLPRLATLQEDYSSVSGLAELYAQYFKSHFQSSHDIDGIKALLEVLVVAGGVSHDGRHVPCRAERQAERARPHQVCACCSTSSGRSSLVRVKALRRRGSSRIRRSKTGCKSSDAADFCIGPGTSSFRRGHAALAVQTLRLLLSRRNCREVRATLSGRSRMSTRDCTCSRETRRSRRSALQLPCSLADAEYPSMVVRCLATWSRVSRRRGSGRAFLR